MIDRIVALAALKDNYIWVMVNEAKRSAIVVDPGVSEVVLDFLQAEGLNLQAIFITHHHWDHSNGISDICAHHPVPVYGPANEEIAGLTHPLLDNAVVKVAGFPDFTILSIPGHTRGHLAYYTANHVFTGDTLFAAGCGRLFEGTPEQMFHSLSRLAALPDDTLIYCGHEYTLNNLRFAQTIEANQPIISKRYNEIKALRDKGLISLPVTLKDEKASNPFLRCHVPHMIQAASDYMGMQLQDPIAVFAALRKWKDHF